MNKVEEKLEAINNLMWNTFGVRDKSFGRKEGMQIMEILNQWAKEEGELQQPEKKKPFNFICRNCNTPLEAQLPTTNKMSSTDLTIECYRLKALLDEQPPEAIAFGEWILKGCVLARDERWFDAGKIINHTTTI